jgi:hypothetical protein
MRPRVLVALACLLGALAFAGVGGAGSARTLDRSTADRPDEAVGPQVHAIYALPSDGQDAALDTNGTVGAWLSAFNDWLAQQSGGVRVRIDTAQGVPDVSFLRLSQTTAELSGDPVVAYMDVLGAVADAGFSGDGRRYVVVVAAGSDNICGLGGTAGLALLFVGTCDGVSWAFVAGHELFHTLGAVSSCAAHSNGAGHLTDPSNDLMWPYAQPPDSTPALDPGHDDYWGPPGDNHLPPGCPASANLAESDYMTSHPFYRLLVAAGANGSVDLTGSAGAADQCTPDAACNEVARAGTRYTLTAQADAGYRFAGWTGASCPTATCSVTPSADASVAAAFVALPELSLTVRGRGRVVAPSVGTTCSAACSVTVPYEQATALRATAAKGWRFAGWNGACRGKTPTCSVTLGADASATATFAKQLPLCAKGKRSTAKRPCRRR